MAILTPPFSLQPKLWNELQAGVESLMNLVQLIELMASSSADADAEAAGTADVLQTQIVYNGEVLDIALESLKAYRPGTQSLAYLESSVSLAYVLLRRLEKYAQEGGGSYVRRKARRRRGECCMHTYVHVEIAILMMSISSSKASECGRRCT